MKKVVNTENAKIKNKKSLTLKALKGVLVGVSLLLIGKEVGLINFPQTAQVQTKKANIVAATTIDGIRLEIASPEMRIIDGEIVYVAPEGFIYENGTCYRLSSTAEPPAGYVKGMDNETLHRVDSESKYYAPEGYILVGSKAVSVVDPVLEEIDDKEVFTLPEGYILVNQIGMKIIDAIPINTLHMP